MKGILYGIGTGPGDSSLITQKAFEIIKSCQVIALPSLEKDKCTAYKIIKDLYPEIDKKEFLLLDFPMTKNSRELSGAHKNSADAICKILDQGKNISFITIGDVTISSTFFYIRNFVEENGYESILVNGIPSFCAAAAKLGISLSEQNEEIHIIPGSYEIEKSFCLDGTLIYMKSGKKLSLLKNYLLKKKESFNFEFYAISNCGMENEIIHSSIEEIPEDSSYFTIVIIKNKTKKETEKFYSFFQNTKCENFPCHKIENIENFNCLFCYCPLYFLGDKCGGNYKFTDKGIKSCINCNIPHKKENYELIKNKLMENRKVK